jgi:four helix bundle protein
MSFHCRDVALELARAVREPWRRLRAEHASSLADQLVRATQSVVLNICEGSRLRRKSAVHSFTIAAGSASEVDGALRCAEALGLLTVDEIAAALALCDRLGAMLHRLTH